MSSQVEKVSLLKESVSQAEVAWSVVKPNTTSTSPVEPQNPSNSSDIACRSKMKRGKTIKKRRKKKRVLKGLAGMALADHDPESSNHSTGQTKKTFGFPILYNRPPPRTVGDIKSFTVSKEAK